MAMSWEKKGRKSSALSLSQLNSRWRCIASIRFIGPWWMSPCVISLRLYLGPSSFLFTLLVCVCVYVCDGERDSGGPKDLNERDTTSQIHRWPCVALSLSLSLICVWALSVSLLLLSVDRLNHAATITRPQIKSSSHTHNETRENTSRKKEKRHFKRKEEKVHPSIEKSEWKGGGNLRMKRSDGLLEKLSTKKNLIKWKWKKKLFSLYFFID